MFRRGCGPGAVVGLIAEIWREVVVPWGGPLLATGLLLGAGYLLFILIWATCKGPPSLR